MLESGKARGLGEYRAGALSWMAKESSWRKEHLSFEGRIRMSSGEVGAGVGEGFQAEE